MLNKLLKYDLKSMGKSLFVPYIGILVLAIIVKLLGLLSAKFSIFGIAMIPIQAVFYILMIGSFFYTFFVSVRRYYKNIFKDEGYLTNTLPVKKSSILISKIFSNVLYMFLNTAIVIFALWIVGILDIFAPILNSVVLELNVSKTMVLLIMPVFIFISYISYLLLFYTALAVGHTSYKDKLVYSVVAGIVIYFINQFVSLLGSLPFFIMNIKLFSNPDAALAPHSVTILLSTTFIIQVMVIIVSYFVTKFALDKKFNIG